MCATKTTDVEATAATCERLRLAGAGVVRVAVDSPNDADALKIIRTKTTANLSVDLQENYRLAEAVAPYVDKIRYNPGHLHHVEPNVPWQKKVERLMEIARQHSCALRVGVNCGSLDPSLKSLHDDPMLASALTHAEFLDSLGFDQFCVSIKSSSPEEVVMANRAFAKTRPDIPLHLGVTEAGLPPEGVVRTRLALEPLLAEGIGDTLRVSLTVPNDRKSEEIAAGQLILNNVAKNTIISPDDYRTEMIEIICCPSCARVQNERFVALAEEVRAAMVSLRGRIDRPLKIAVMGCRVNGPGETDNADWGLWCGPNAVNLKRGPELVGAFGYDDIVATLLAKIAESRGLCPRAL